MNPAFHPPAIIDYTLIDRIGAGSYGEVWRARGVTGRECAIKVVHRGSFSSERPYLREFDGICRFESISRGHPHLVAVFHVGRLEGDAGFYYSMELADPVPGAGYRPRTLRVDLDSRGFLPAGELLALGAGLAEALKHLHEHGLIHRDVKPSNIIVVDGVPKLADIGLVAEAGESRSFVGTEGFVPPEGPGSVQGDVYSLGKVLFEAMTGRDRTEFPELPVDFGSRPDHPALLELNEIILRACDRNPARRQSSMDEVLTELRLLQAGHSLRRIHQVERRLNRFRQLGAVVGVVAALASVAWWLASADAARQRRNFEDSERLRRRAETADQRARELLHETSVALARASRLTMAAGRLGTALDAIRQGVSVRPSRELANELIGILAGDDLRHLRSLTNLPSLRAAAFNPAMTEMALPASGRVLVQDIERGVIRLTLSCPEASVPWLAWGPDGRWLAARHDSGRVRVWDAGTGATAFDAEGVGPFPSFATNRILLPFPSDRRLELWNPESAKCVGSLPVAFDFDTPSLSPDGRFVAINPIGIPAFRVLDWRSGRTSEEFPLESSAFSVAWSGDSRWVALGSDDNAVYLWSREPDGPRLRLTGHQNHIHNVTFLAGDRFLASSCWDGTTRLWEIPTGREVLRLSASGHLGAGGADPVLAVQSYRSTEMQLYRLTQSQAVTSFSLPSTNRLISPFDVEFSPDGTRLAAGAWDGAHVLEVATGRRLGGFPERFARTVRFVESGRSLMVSGSTGCRRWSLEKSATGEPAVLAPGHFWNVGDASPSGDVTALARGGEVWVLRGASTRPEVFRRPPQQFQRAVLSSDGRWVAASGRLELGFAVWDLKSGGSPSWAPPSTPQGCEVQFSPDARVFVVGDSEQYCAYSTQDGRVRWRIHRHDTAVLHGLMAFTADSRLLACALSRTVISIHSAATGERLATLEHPDPQQVLGLAFSPDGRRLAVASPAHQVRVWDLRHLGAEVRLAGLPWVVSPAP